MTVIKEPTTEAKAAIIWLHGLGASADGLVALSTMLSIEDWPVRHIFLQAPMRSVTVNHGMQMPAWYDIKSENINDDEDEDGIVDSSERVAEVIKQQQESGIDAENIFLAGFSQGGVISLYTALSTDMSLGGVIVLSGYLALREKVCTMSLKHRQSLPVFMSFGTYDPIIHRSWTLQSVALLQDCGLRRIESLEFEKEHNVCAKELALLRKWLQSHLEVAGT